MSIARRFCPAPNAYVLKRHLPRKSDENGIPVGSPARKPDDTPALRAGAPFPICIAATPRSDGEAASSSPPHRPPSHKLHWRAAGAKLDLLESIG
jgi:hypothetical protein